MIVIGGYHDSATFLEAPKNILSILNVHVVGAIGEDPEDEIVLVKDEQGELELVVCAIPFLRDRDIRKVGESFIVSLALARGLSQMSSRNMRVDSLFLDEGFGTLDEDTLETALGTLANLQQEGKMIGIISHVGALKDRINTRISVQPLREGKSVISGPGCEQR